MFYNNNNCCWSITTGTKPVIQDRVQEDAGRAGPNLGGYYDALVDNRYKGTFMTHNIEGNHSTNTAFTPGYFYSSTPYNLSLNNSGMIYYDDMNITGWPS
jgi:hypothetical protein